MTSESLIVQGAAVNRGYFNGERKRVTWGRWLELVPISVDKMGEGGKERVGITFIYTS